MTGESRLDRARLAIEWLERSTEPWLVVFDNAADRDGIRGWLPTRGVGQVLVTTRNRDLTTLGSTIDVDLLAPEDARAFLRERVAERNESAAADGAGVDLVGAELHGLPLALEQAAAWVARSPRRTWEDYLTLFERVDRDAFPPETVPDAYAATASTTWKVSIEAAAEEAPLAPRLLDALAYVAPDDIPLDIIVFDGSEDDSYLGAERLDVEEALDALHVYSLVTLSASAASVHRVVQHVTRSDAAVQALPFVLDRLAALVPLESTHPGTWERCEQLEPHVIVSNSHARPLNAETAESASWALDRIATYLQYSGAVHAAIAHFELALDDLVLVLGDRHPDTLMSRANLALSYWSVGRHVEAIDLNERVLADRVEVLGDRHPDTLTSRGNLATSYRSVGRHVEAIDLNERVLADRVVVLGDRHPDTLMSRGNLANSYWSVGRHVEAIDLNERVLADRVVVLGDRHPDTLTSRGNLANSYWSVGRHVEAIELNERVLADRVEVLGDRHPDTLTSRSNLAESYRAVGRHVDAIELDERVLADRVVVLGDRHPSTLMSRANLAESYRAVGRHVEAIDLDERVLADRVEVLGDRHPDTLMSRANLAESYRSVGRHVEAIDLNERVLADRVVVLGDRHPDTLSSQANLANSYWSVGRHDDAIELLRATITQAAQLDHEHPYLASWRDALSEWTST